MELTEIIHYLEKDFEENPFDDYEKLNIETKREIIKSLKDIERELNEDLW